MKGKQVNLNMAHALAANVKWLYASFFCDVHTCTLWKLQRSLELFASKWLLFVGIQISFRQFHLKQSPEGRKRAKFV